MKISVIIPTYKPQSYLWECLHSLVEQTYPKEKFEVILVLNGCRNPYETDIKYFIETKMQGMNLNFIQTDQSGVSNARNIGIDNAKGEYICFVDDDDIVSPQYLELLLEKANEETLVVSNVYSFTNSIEEKKTNFFICKHLEKKEAISNSSLFENRSYLAFPVAKIIHKNIIGNRRFDVRFRNGEDALFITSISDKIKRIVYAGDSSIYYVRERIGSASRKLIAKKKLLGDAMKLIGAYFKVYSKSPLSYSFLLFISRIPGVLKNMYILSNNK